MLLSWGLPFSFERNEPPGYRTSLPGEKYLVGQGGKDGETALEACIPTCHEVGVRS